MNRRRACVEASAILLALTQLVGCARAALPQPSPTIVVGTETRHARPRVLFRRALALADRGDDDAARGLFTTLLESYPALEDYHLAYLVAIDARQKRLDEAIAFADRLVAAHPQSVWLPLTLARRAELALARGEPDAASALAGRALAAPGGNDESRALASLVEADLRAREDPRAAYGLYLDVRRLGGEAAAVARARCTALTETHPELLRERSLLVAEADVLAAEGHLDLAADRLRTAADAAPPEERGPLLRSLARTLKADERFDEAIGILRTAASSSATDPARFELALLLWSRDHDREARGIFEQMLRDEPQHPGRDTLHYALARIAEDTGDLSSALARYRALVAGGRDAGLVREARWRLGWAPYRAGDLSTAARAFADVARDSPEDRTGALYWQGRVRGRLGDGTGATTIFEVVARSEPDGYYAGIAEQRLGLRPPSPESPRPLHGSAPAMVTEQTYHWRRLEELLAAGLGRRGAPELDALLRDLPPAAAQDPLLLPVFASVHAHARALALALRLRQQGILSAEESAAYEYPQAYWTLVTSVAAAERLDPYLLLAVMRQESHFDPEASSPAGARGLLQLMPRTAARIAGSPADLHALSDPRTNVRLGAQYLRELLDRYAGSLPKAIAAYNGGEDAVGKWEGRAPNAEPDEFVENISFRETRKYVKIVLANYRRYQRLYGPTAPG